MPVKLNEAALKHAKKLIEENKVVRESDWSESQPSDEAESKVFDKQGSDEYGLWFLAIDTDEKKDSKRYHKFPYGDFKRVHRKGLIAAKQRAAQNDYHSIEKAAGDLLELIDKQESMKAK
jgi:hypothetical protein